MVKFIAEICSNHNNSLPRAIQLIQSATSIGCDAVKFQLFRIDKLFHYSILNHPKYQFLQERRQWELPIHWLHELKECCIDNHIEFGCTPFYLDAVEELYHYVDFYKMSSYDLNRVDLMKYICETSKPLVLSTGMATLAEIDRAVQNFGEFTDRDYRRLTLLHCISEYPTPVNHCNLSFIGKLNLIHSDKIKVGWSDHSVSIPVIQRAVSKWNAQVIEFHLDLDDEKGNEFKQCHCWNETHAEWMIKAIKWGLEADGKWNYGVEGLEERGFRADSEDGLRPERWKREELE